MTNPFEAEYPLNFREQESRELGQYLKNRQSIVLIGMKRVGISNFLRFFINHPKVKSQYIKENRSHIFIPVDLNDLVEREIYPFWTLTLKRIADAVGKSPLPQSVKKFIDELFLESIQSQDLFLTIESIRRSLIKIVENNCLPTLFFLRFDRMKDTVTPEFFTNLQGLREATAHNLSFVFTSYRNLSTLSPQAFNQSPLLSFTKDLYLKPAQHQDLEVIFNSYKKRFQLKLSKELEQGLFETVDGYIQYLQLALVVLHENATNLKTKNDLFEALAKDERINLQSEELWESLDTQEQEVLEMISQGKKPSLENKEKTRYLWDTGLVSEENKIFSPLLTFYLDNRVSKPKVENNGVELSKKENLLFNFLKSNQDKICAREEIIQAVWPETENLGISDWAIDRLVARVRNKLKKQNNDYEIVTVKTRGYKLVLNYSHA